MMNGRALRSVILVGVAAFGPSIVSAADDDRPPITLETALVPSVVIQGPPGAVGEPITLRERMERAGVPGLSIAVVVDGEVAWAHGFGMADIERGVPVNERTLFQAASISKPVAAAGAMRLVQEGVMDLGRDIGEDLTSWTIPAYDRVPGEPVPPVTLRGLLSHRAGMTVHGFPGYQREAEIPSPVGVLDGVGNTDPVVVATPPGSAHKYSGGGYTVAQVAMVDADGRFADFPSLMSSLVLGPLGMADSTFEQPLPTPLHGRAATGYTGDGSPIDGSWHVYPEMAAAGLWTTPSDLARFFASLQRGMAGIDGPVLSAASVGEMLRFEGDVRYGLGLNVGTERIGHGGGNAGFRCVATFFNEGGDGAVIMSNSDNGWPVNSDVLRTIFVAMDWPGLRPIEKTVVALTEAQLGRCVGAYEVEGYGAIRVEIDEKKLGLVVTMPDGGRFSLLPESDRVFFDPDDGVPITFEIDGDGPAASAVWSGVTATRRP